MESSTKEWSEYYCRQELEGKCCGCKKDWERDFILKVMVVWETINIINAYAHYRIANTFER